MRTKRIIFLVISLIMISRAGVWAQSTSTTHQKAKIPTFVNFAMPGFLAFSYQPDEWGGIERWGLINYEGDVIYDGTNSWISPARGRSGNLVISNSSGYVKYGEKGKGYGVVNKDNTVVVKPGFKDIELYETYCVGEDSSGEISIIHLPSLSVIEKFRPSFQISDILEISEGKILVANENGFAFYDLKGRIVIPYERLKDYYSVTAFREQRAAVVREGDDEDFVGFIDETGKEVIPAQYLYDETLEREEILPIFFYDGRVKMFDRDYNEVWIDKYGHPTKAGVSYEQAFDVYDTYPNEKWDETTGLSGYADESGEIVIKPIYEYAYPFYHGYALVQKNGKVSLIDNKGNVVLRNIAKGVFISG